MQSKRIFLIDTGFWLLWTIAALICFSVLYQHVEPVIQALVAILGGLFFGLVVALVAIRYRDLSRPRTVKSGRAALAPTVGGDSNG
jgi:hypothetical protein